MAIPGSGDTIFFRGPSAVIVTSTSDAVVTKIQVGTQDASGTDQGNFTLNLGNTTLSSGTTVAFGLDYTAFVAGGSKSLTIASGTMTVTNIQMQASNQSGVMSDLTITGTGSVINTGGVSGSGPTSNYNQIGKNGAGRVYLQSGGVWNVTASSTEFGSAATGNGLLQISGAGSAFNGSSSNVGSARYSFFAGAGGTGTVQVLSGGALLTDDFNIARTSAANGSVTVDGSGSSLVAKRLYVGGGANTGGAGPTAGGTGSLTISNGATATVSEDLIVYGAGTVNFTGGTLNTTGATVLNIQGGSVTGSGTIGGGGGVRVDIMTGASINASGGSLTIANGLTVGQAGGSPVVATLTGAVDVLGTSWIRTNHTLQVDGTWGGSGGVTLDGALSGIGTISKPIQSDGNVISSAGTLTLASNYTIGSNFTSHIPTGTVAVNGTTSFTAGTRTLNLNGVLGGTGDLVLTNGTIIGTGTISKTGGTIGGTGTVSGTVSTVLSNGAITGGNFANGVTVVNSTISGGSYTGSLTAGSGAGSAITGNISVTGSTSIVSGGALAVNATLSGAGVLNVAGVLSGTGAINKAVTVSNGGTLSPGNSPGNQTHSSLALEAGGDYNWQVLDATGSAGSGFDTITVTGVLNLTALSTSTKFDINLWSLSSTGPDVSGNALNFNAGANQSWTLISAGSINTTGLVGSLSDYFNVNTGAANGTAGFSNNFGAGSFSVATSGNNLLLQFVVPEPATFSLVALSLGACFLRRNRKGGALNS